MKSYLLGTGNDGYRYRYEFEKKKEFKELFNKFMQELGFEEEQLYFFNHDYKQNENGEEIAVPRDVTKIENSIENYKNKDFDIDVVYFNKFIFLIIRTKKHEVLVKALTKHFEFENE